MEIVINAWLINNNSLNELKHSYTVSDVKSVQSHK